MTFFERLKNGWKIGWSSLEIIKENPSLLLFVVMSGGAMILVVASFFTSLFLVLGVPGMENLAARMAEWEGNNTVMFIVLFLFYLIAYFIIVFFNVGLVYCTRQIFEGVEPSVRDGLKYSVSRINVILPWAALAATVGVVLKMIEEKAGFVGQIVISLIGAVWSIATFFILPVIAFENIGPVDAVKRSARIMREQWGESIGANFSFAAFYILGYLAGIVFGITMFSLNPFIAIAGGILIIVLVHTVVASANTVFITGAYRKVQHQSAGHFDDNDALDHLFVEKKRKR